MQLSELLSEVAAARHPGTQAAVQAVVSALKAALSSLPQSQLSAAATAATTSAAGALAGVVRQMGPDAQVCFSTWHLDTHKLSMQDMRPVITRKG